MQQWTIWTAALAAVAAVCQTSSLSNVISILILLPSVLYILMMNGLKRPLKKVNSWIVLVIVELWQATAENLSNCSTLGLCACLLCLQIYCWEGNWNPMDFKNSSKRILILKWNIYLDLCILIFYLHEYWGYGINGYGVLPAQLGPAWTWVMI